VSFVVDLISMGQDGGKVNRVGTPSQLSHAIQEVCHGGIILCLGGKGTTVDSTRELTTLGGRGGQITTLGEDLLSVGV